MGDFRTELLGAVRDRGKGDIADAIGMPDDLDLEVLRKIVQKFEAKYPGHIRACLQAGRRDYELGVHRRKQIFTGKALVSKESNMTYVFELPANLYFAIEKVFPSMFKSKKHFAWFKQQFHQLTIGGDKK